MALVIKDRVKQTSSTTGTGAFFLNSVAGPFEGFSTIGDGNQTYYAIVGQTTTEWEVGIGTYTLSTDSISRDTILSSSNSNTIVTFSAGVKDVFITYPAEKAIYEEPNGDTLINAGPITVLGPGVSGSPSAYADTLGRFYGNQDSYQQVYLQNQYNGADASADFVAYNNLGDGTNYFIDMGIAGSSYSSAFYPIFSANCAYVYNSGLTTGTGAAGETSELLIGTGTLNSDLVLFTGGVDTTNEAVRVSGADQTVEVQKGVTLNETLDVTGAATFGSTVLLNANPSTALQAATKQYVDNQVTAGIHIHAPVRVTTTGNLNATYTGGGTNANIIQIANGTDVTFFSVTPSVGDQFYIGSSSNGLLANTAYFIVNDLGSNTYQVSLTFGGAIVTGLTNGSPTIPSVINSGVGATLTNAGTQVALSIDGISLSSTNRVLVNNQTTASQNGVYTVTTVGDGSTNWVLTRATDADRVNPSDPDGVGTGDYFFVQEGLTGAGDSYVLTTEPNTMIIGYTNLTYTQFSGAVTYVGGTNIDVTGQTISLTGTVAPTNGGTGVNTVTTGDLLYGSASNTWSKLAKGSAYQSLLMNAGGTQLEWNALNLSSSAAVTGALGATFGGTGQTTYATGDILYSSASNTLSKLAGTTSTSKHFLSQTGTGSASAAPSWDELSAADITSGTLGAVRGGTGQSSYAVGDILYADTTTSLAKLADVATGNVLLSGGVSAAPSWGKVALASAVSGTLGTTNGGTGTTTATGSGSVVLNNTPTLISPILGTPTSGDFSSGTFTWPTFNQNTTGTAGNVSGIVAIANGGTGESTRQAAMDALAGATTSGYYLRGDGTNVVMAAIQAGDVPTLNQSTTGTASGISGSQTANYIYAAPNGSAGTASFRAMVAADVPTLNQNTTGTASNITAYTISQNMATTSSVQFGSFGVGTAASGTSGEIRATNNVTAYYSDDRFKTNLGNIPNALDKVQTLNGFYYEANELAQSYGYEVKREVGVSAQQVQAIMPEVVAPAPIDEEYLTVRYERLVPLLIEAIKELKAEVDELKKAK